jgi:hypothetical protein
MVTLKSVFHTFTYLLGTGCVPFFMDRNIDFTFRFSFSFLYKVIKMYLRQKE